MAFAVGNILKLTGKVPTWSRDASHNSKAPPYLPNRIKITAVRAGIGYQYTLEQGPATVAGVSNSFASEDCSDPLLTAWTLTA